MRRILTHPRHDGARMESSTDPELKKADVAAGLSQKISPGYGQSVSIAPTSASATVTPLTLASPWNHHIVLRRPMLDM